MYLRALLPKPLKGIQHRYWLSVNGIMKFIHSLKEATTEFENFDFNANKPQQYEELRRSSSINYCDQPELLSLIYMHQWSLCQTENCDAQGHSDLLAHLLRQFSAFLSSAFPNFCLIVQTRPLAGPPQSMHLGP